MSMNSSRKRLSLERGDLQKHRILVQAETAAQLPEVRGNRIQLQQVLVNLITNAIDSMAAKDEPGCSASNLRHTNATA